MQSQARCSIFTASILEHGLVYSIAITLCFLCIIVLFHNYLALKQHILAYKQNNHLSVIYFTNIAAIKSIGKK